MRFGQLDDPVNKRPKRARLPGNNGEDIAIRNLLTHGSVFEKIAQDGSGHQSGNEFSTPVGGVRIFLPDWGGRNPDLSYTPAHDRHL